MSSIDLLKIKNFKAFNEEFTIDIGGRHLLLYGENGSGKSSIYWSLYTLLQSTTKSEEEIEKYFDRNNSENLLNIFSGSDDSFIKISAIDEVNTFHSIGKNGYSLEGTTTRPYNYPEALNSSSDFIAHRLLINFYNFRNSKEINLWEVFVRDIFPFLTTTYNTQKLTLSQLFNDIKETLPFWNFNQLHKTFKVRQANHHQRIATNDRINSLNRALKTELATINGLVNKFYEDHFKENYEEKIEISLKYSVELKFGDITQSEERGGIKYFFSSKKHIALNRPFISLKIKNQKEDGSWHNILRPQSYFNEAKLTQIALSIRFALTEQRMGTFPEQFLALDDLLVSLDMSNRDKVLDILLGKFASNYKIYLFTHEKSFFEFCLYKIQQYNQKKEWTIQEIYECEGNGSQPTIVKAEYDNYEKAKKYFKAKDYVTTSLYLRKEFEKVVKERLPIEYTKVIEGKPPNLAYYWGEFRKHYKALGIDMDALNPEMNDNFEQSKTFILNRQAHHNLSEPVYTIELKKVFDLIDEIKTSFPIPETTILLSKGMNLKFSHPDEDYTMEFKLVNDWKLNKIGGNKDYNIPKCQIITWQYEDVEFWDFKKGKKLDKAPKPTDNNLNYIKETLVANKFVPLNITEKMFWENTSVHNGLCSLKELMDGYNVTI